MVVFGDRRGQVRGSGLSFKMVVVLRHEGHDVSGGPILILTEEFEGTWIG